MATVLLSTFFTDPRPGPARRRAAGDRSRSWLLAAGLVLARRAATSGAPGARFVGLVARRRSRRCIFAAVQPDERRLRGRLLRDGDRRHPARPRRRDHRLRRHRRRARRDPADRARQPAPTVAGLLFSVAAVVPGHAAGPPARRAPRRGRGAVEELRESRAAHAESAALAERGRVARELHDVLAHSLSALALQLEGTRLLARDRGADPEVVAGLERAHHLAVSGLTEARQAISALRGDELPASAGGPRATRFPSATLHRHRHAARAVLRGAARALPHRPGGADQRAPPQRVRARGAAARATRTTARR